MENGGQGPGGISVVFFDLGKVILNFDHDNIVERLLSRRQAPGEWKDELFEFLFDARDGLCNLYDAGRISSLDFYGEIDRRFCLMASYEEFTGLWNGIFTECREVSDIVRRVRKHRRAYLLSNVNELHWEHARGRFGVLSELDGWVLSYKVKARKPEKAIFDAALNMAGAGGGEVVFIDDLEDNTRAAGERGMHAITFKGAGALEKRLLEMGLL